MSLILFAFVFSGGNAIGVGILMLVFLARFWLRYFRSYIKLTSTGLILRDGALIIHEEETKYNKINKVEIQGGLFYSDILIYLSNDHPITFTHVERVHELKEKIMQRVENRIVNQRQDQHN
jgi:hypothetical protein